MVRQRLRTGVWGVRRRRRRGARQVDVDVVLRVLNKLLQHLNSAIQRAATSAHAQLRRNVASTHVQAVEAVVDLCEIRLQQVLQLL